MSTIYEINTPHVISESLGDETVIINLETGTYHSLNRNAALIWQNLRKPIATNLLLEMMTVKEVVDQSAIAKALEDFLGVLLAQGLVRLSTTKSHSENITKMSLEDLQLVCDNYNDMQDLLGLDPIHEADPQAGWPHKH